jgi:hypothetical protein
MQKKGNVLEDNSREKSGQTYAWLDFTKIWLQPSAVVAVINEEEG